MDAGFWAIVIPVTVVATSGFITGVRLTVGNVRNHDIKRAVEYTALTTLMGALAVLMTMLIYDAVTLY